MIEVFLLVVCTLRVVWSICSVFLKYCMYVMGFNAFLIYSVRSKPLLLVHGNQREAKTELEKEAEPYPNIKLFGVSNSQFCLSLILIFCMFVCDLVCNVCVCVCVTASHLY